MEIVQSYSGSGLPQVKRKDARNSNYQGKCKRNERVHRLN
jgi:hypothetical protein